MQVTNENFYVKNALFMNMIKFILFYCLKRQQYHEVSWIPEQEDHRISHMSWVERSSLSSCNTIQPETKRIKKIDQIDADITMYSLDHKKDTSQSGNTQH